MFKLYIFDFDGTLIDSKNDLARSVNHILEVFGLERLDEEIIYPFIGDGASMLVKRAFAAQNKPELTEEALKVFFSHYGKHLLDTTKCYPEIHETLSKLKRGGASLSLLTNKPFLFTTAIAEGLKLSYFDYIFGGDSFENKKPHPEGILKIMELAGAEPEDTLMVGDSDKDIIAGKAAGVKTCGVTYGIKPETLYSIGTDYMIEKFSELLLI